MLSLPHVHQIVNLGAHHGHMTADEADKCAKVLNIEAQTKTMLEVVLYTQWTSWVVDLFLLLFLSLSLLSSFSNFITFDQVLETELHQVKEPIEDVVRDFEATRQLFLALNFPRSDKVEIRVKFSRFDGILPAFREDIYEEGSVAHEARLALKEFHIVLCQVAFVALNWVLNFLAILNERAHNSEVFLVLSLSLQVVSHLNLEQSTNLVDRTCEERRQLVGINFTIKEADIQKDAGQTPCTDHPTRAVDKLRNGTE